MPCEVDKVGFGFGYCYLMSRLSKRINSNLKLKVYFINIIKSYKVRVTKSLLFNERKGDSQLYLPAVGNMNRRELGHKCVPIPRIVALYILVGRLLFSLAHDNTSVYNMTSEAARENEYC